MSPSPFINHASSSSTFAPSLLRRSLSCPSYKNYDAPCDTQRIVIIGILSLALVAIILIAILYCLRRRVSLRRERRMRKQEQAEELGIYADLGTSMKEESWVPAEPPPAYTKARSDG